jgi:hypothetical protein
MMLTALGRQKDMAIPLRARKTVNWIPVCERPQPTVKAMSRTQPVRYIVLPPMTSAMEPERRRVQPQERA